jgi:hypothetical protein
MAKLTIDEVEYDTDDFNEDQMKVYNEILYAHDQLNRLNYTVQVLNERCVSLSKIIVDSSKEVETKDE